MILRLLSLEALYNTRGGQKWGWILAIRGSVPVETMRVAIREVSSMFNVTPQLSGLLSAIWRRRLIATRDPSGASAPLSSMASAASARGDRFFWGEARPTLLILGTASVLTLGAPGALAVPVLWGAAVLGMLWWGIQFGSRCSDGDVVGLLSSTTWDDGQRMLGRFRRIILGLVIGMWLAWSPDADLIWVAAPLIGIAAVLLGFRSPLRWGAVGLAVAIILGYLVEALTAGP